MILGSMPVDICWPWQFCRLGDMKLQLSQMNAICPIYIFDHFYLYVKNRFAIIAFSFCFKQQDAATSKRAVIQAVRCRFIDVFQLII